MAMGLPEPRETASLSSGLLARKGRARPAMRAGVNATGNDLGWNDWGSNERGSSERRVDDEAPSRARPSVARLHIPRARSRVARAANEPHPAQQVPTQARRIAFTLRLEQERHARLRAACARLGLSGQSLVTEALDAFLRQYPELADQADTVRSAG